MEMKPKRLAWAIMLALAHGAPAQADETREKELGETVVNSRKSPVPADLPATAEGVTATQIGETVNAQTTAATLKYLPSIVVRERYIGDRNGIVSTRTSGTISSAQSVVYGDGLLLSNFLGNSYSYPPRWGMVTPSEIDRVDIIYGPFSALYPGNSSGGVVLLSTRMPDKFEAHASLQASQQQFKLYGSSERYDSTQASASVGNRVGDWSFRLSGDRLDARGQPMSFGTAKLSAGAGGTDVAGAFADRDQAGAMRLITGAYSIDHTVQNNGTVKIAYDLTPTVRATYTLGVWQNDSDTAADTYLRRVDTGAPFYNTASGQFVRINGQRYTVSGVAPGHAESEHWMHGLSVRSNSHGEWEWEAGASLYDYQRDISRTASNTGGDSGTGPVRPGGSLIKMDGTGWQTLDLRGEWRPGGADAAIHRVSLGYHYDRYVLDSHTYDTLGDWLTGGAGAENSASQGKTETQALYLQEAWRFTPDWKAVLGARAESWRAYDGINANSTSTPRRQSYPAREAGTFSPKLGLSWQASADWLLRGSVGKATRFPSVSELFQSITSGANKLLNDPNLKPESVWSGELAAERGVGAGLLRVSLFQEDKRDALYSQTDTSNVTSIQNVDKIRTRGVEAAWQLFDAGLPGLDLTGSLTYADSIILRDDRNPAVVGKRLPRIPDWRAKLVATYHQGDALSYTLAARYSGNQHIQLNNLDNNPGTYGGASKFFIVDAKVAYRVAKQWSASLGVDNLNNYKAYVSHPWPQRTVFAGVKYDY